MFKPNFQRTDLLIGMIARIEVARDRILRAPIVPRWEAELRQETLARSAHHSTSIKALRSVDPQTQDLTEWLEYFMQGIAVEMIRVERRVEELRGLCGRPATTSAS